MGQRRRSTGESAISGRIELYRTPEGFIDVRCRKCKCDELVNKSGTLVCPVCCELSDGDSDGAGSSVGSGDSVGSDCS